MDFRHNTKSARDNSYLAPEKAGKNNVFYDFQSLPMIPINLRRLHRNKLATLVYVYIVSEAMITERMSKDNQQDTKIAAIGHLTVSLMGIYASAC